MRKIIVLFFIVFVPFYSFSQVKVLSNGNVGIGDLTPSALFTVGNNDLFQVTSSGYARSVLGSASTPAYSFTGSTNTGMFSCQANFLNFTTNGTERIRIESDGDVGIGGTGNSGKVYIYQTSTDPGLRVYKTTTTSSYNIISEINADLIKSICSKRYGGSDNFCVWGNGHTEIGAVYSTNYMLAVYGTTYCTSGNWTSSDALFKHNITDIDSPMDKLSQISGKKYEYNTTDFAYMNFSPGFTYGVLAQDVQAVLPELVRADSLGYLAINYDGLIPFLIEAVKEQDKKIEQLEAVIDNCCKAIDGTEKSSIINNNNSDINSGNSKNVLYQNVPNPFGKVTNIRCFVNPQNANAAIYIFDMQGSLKKSITGLTQGENQIIISANEMQPGMYMYSLVVDGKEIDTKKMILTE